MRFAVASVLEDKDYPFWVNGSVIMKIVNTEYDVVNYTNSGRLIAVS